MAEVLPVDVIDWAALVVDLFSNALLIADHLRPSAGAGVFAGLFCRVFVHVLGDLHAVVRLPGLRPDVRLIPHPGHATATQKTILHREFHRRAEIRIVLNLVFQRPLDQQRRHPPHLVVVAVATRYVRRWQFRVNGGDQRLDVRPQDVKPRGSVAAGLIAVVVAIPPDDFSRAPLPGLKLSIVRRDHGEVFRDAGVHRIDHTLPLF